MTTPSRSRETDDALSAVLGGDPMDPSSEVVDTAETAEAFDADAPLDDELEGDANLGFDEDAESVEHDDEPSPVARGHRLGARSPRAAAGSGTLATMAGLACLLGGGALGAMRAQGQLPAGLEGFGLTPATLLAVGAVALGVGVVRRQLSRSQQLLADLTQRHDSVHDDVQAYLQQLLERHASPDGRPPAAGEELERVFVALTRQDEKINNLSRALKMYGKPLMEIATHGSDVAGQVNQLKEHVDGVKEHVDSVLEACRQGFERVARAAAAGGVASETLQGLQQQLVRVEATVTAVGQRVDDSEVRKSLLRLEESDKTRHQLLTQLAAQVARGDAVQQGAQRLEQVLDGGLKKLEQGLGQLRSGELSGLDAAVRDVQRELSGVATAMAQLQQAMKKGFAAAPSAAAAVAVAAAKPVATAPAAGASTAAAPAQPAAAPTAGPAAPATGPNATEDAAAGVAQNQTGTRATSGKNVLGAIAKLKKMKN